MNKKNITGMEITERRMGELKFWMRKLCGNHDFLFK